MKGASIRLCLYGMIMLMELQSISMAESLSLEQLRDQILRNGTVSGRFVQCTTHGSTHIAGSGKFTFEPGNRVELNFSQPSRYSINFFSDGTQTRTVAGVGQKTPRHSPLGRLIFSIISMQASLLDSRFEISMGGTIDRFIMSLIPKKRLSKIIQSVEITGTTGLVSTVQITTRDNRAISIYLFPAGQPVGATCE